MDIEALMLLLMILVMTACLVATVVYFLFYTGILGPVLVSVGKPVINNVWIAYKHHVGPYSKCGPHFTEACSLCPELSTIGIFYDNPKEVQADKCRYLVGLVLCEGDEKPPQSLITLVNGHNFNLYKLPSSDYVVKAKFPYVLGLCAWLAPFRVYPALERYVKQHKLSAHPFIEYYLNDTIHYMGPLSKQNEFFVPEVEYNIQLSSKMSPEESIGEGGSQTNTSDDESQGTTSSFEEITAE